MKNTAFVFSELRKRGYEAATPRRDGASRQFSAGKMCSGMWIYLWEARSVF
jgi:hypothetical protein